MKKRTIAIVSISLVLAILAVAVIATFPSYLFEEDTNIPATNSSVQNDNIKPSEGDDVGNVGGNAGGVQGVLPDVGFESEDIPQTPSDTTETNKTLETIATDDGAKFISANNAFDKGTKFSINKLGILSKKYYRARHYVQDFAKYYAMYEVTAKKDGQNVQPIDTARVVINIPEKYNIDNVEVYYMLDKGVQKLSAIIDKDARTATVGFMQSGVYILIERDVPKVEDTSSDVTSSENSSSDTTSTESEDASSTTSSNTSSDASNSDASSDTTDSSEDTESDVSSDTSSTESDPNKDTMDGWTPWY